VGYGKESEYDIFGQKKYTEIEMATMNARFKAATQSGRKCSQCQGSGVLEAHEIALAYPTVFAAPATLAKT